MGLQHSIASFTRLIKKSIISSVSSQVKILCSADVKTGFIFFKSNFLFPRLNLDNYSVILLKDFQSP